MTREEVIDCLNGIKIYLQGEHIDTEAIDMAIEALQAEPIVRCNDCDDYVEFAYWFDDEGKKRDYHYCTFHSMEVHGDDFCSWAKRKEQINDKTD